MRRFMESGVHISLTNTPDNDWTVFSTCQMPLLASFSFPLCTEFLNKTDTGTEKCDNYKILESLSGAEDCARRMSASADVRCRTSRSACQYVLLALQELRASLDENIGFNQLMEASTSLEWHCLPASSALRSFQSALRRFRQAEIWATEASLCRSCPISRRAMAVDIRLFCIALANWTELKTWLLAGRRPVLREFLLNLDESFPTDNSNQSGFLENVNFHLINVSQSTVDMIFVLIFVVGVTLADSVFDFSKQIDECVINSKHLRGMGTKSQEKSFFYYSYRACPFAPSSPVNMKSFLQHRFGVRLSSIDYLMLVALSGFHSMAIPGDDTLWVTDATDKILLIPLNAPFPEQSRLIDDSRCWTILGWAPEKKRVYAIGSFDPHISIFDTATGFFLTKERILLPVVGHGVDTWRIRVIEDGSILACNSKLKRRFILFPSSMTDHIVLPSSWHEIEGGSQKWKLLQLKKDDQLISLADSRTNEFLLRVSINEKGQILLGRILRVKNGKVIASRISVCAYRLAKGTVLLRAYHDKNWPSSLTVYALTCGQSQFPQCCASHSQVLRLRVNLDDLAVAVEERWCLLAEFVRPAEVREVVASGNTVFIGDNCSDRILTPVE